MGEFLSYTEALTRSMFILAQHPKTLFVGQSISYDGQAMHKTFSGVPMDRRIEFPVSEDFQMGFCTGLALQGYIPVCCFPRMDFMLLAANQLVNHLDKIPEMGFDIPKVIIRTAIGSTSPLNPGPQHTQNHTEALKLMLNTIQVYEVKTPQEITDAYLYAEGSNASTLIIEHMSMYD